MEPQLGWRHMLVAALVVVFIALLVRYCVSTTDAGNACEKHCQEQGMERWFYDDGDCRCSSAGSA